MNKVKRFLIGATSGVVMFGSMVFPALAAQPADPDCLGTNVSGFAQATTPFGQNVVTKLTGGGFGDEVLGHLQGVPEVSTCPDDGFPTPTL